MLRESLKEKTLFYKENEIFRGVWQLSEDKILER